MKTKLIIVVALSLIFMCGCSQNQDVSIPDISSSQIDEISKPESLVSNNGKEKAYCEVTRIRYDEFSDKIDNLNVGSFYRVGDKIFVVGSTSKTTETPLVTTKWFIGDIEKNEYKEIYCDVSDWGTPMIKYIADIGEGQYRISFWGGGNAVITHDEVLYFNDLEDGNDTTTFYCAEIDTLFYFDDKDRTLVMQKENAKKVLYSFDSEHYPLMINTEPNNSNIVTFALVSDTAQVSSIIKINTETLNFSTIEFSAWMPNCLYIGDTYCAVLENAIYYGENLDKQFTEPFENDKQTRVFINTFHRNCADFLPIQISRKGEKGYIYELCILYIENGEMKMKKLYETEDVSIIDYCIVGENKIAFKTYDNEKINELIILTF